MIMCVFTRTPHWSDCLTTHTRSNYTFDTSVDIEASCGDKWLIPHNPHCFTVKPGKSYHNVLGIMLLDLKEITFVNKESEVLIGLLGAVGLL